MTTSARMIYPDWPMFGIREDVTQFALSYLTAGTQIALATLIHTEGGGPRAPGTQMAFSDDDMTGFLSGGCVEADVALHARATLMDGEPHRLIYGQGSLFGDIRLQCGASITIAVERVLPSDPIVDGLVKMMATRQDLILVSDGTARTASSQIHELGVPWPNIPEQTFSSPHNGGQIDEKHYWVRYRPPTRLIIIGSDPIALAIAQLAKEAEFEVIFVRPHGPMLPPPPAPHVYRPMKAESVFKEFGLDSRTAVVFANHDFEATGEDIVCALRSGAGYVGMVGAERHRAVKNRWFKQVGLSEADIARFRSPIGMPIGKSSPFAIAISVIAEILCVMNQH